MSHNIPANQERGESSKRLAALNISINPRLKVLRDIANKPRVDASYANGSKDGLWSKPIGSK